jgi:hypothetical protein
MKLHTSILTLFLLALVPVGAHAQVRQVGPTNFHKQIQFPNAMGKNNAFSNDDSFSGGSSRRANNAQNRRAERLRERNATNDEARTQSDTSARQKRKGRRQMDNDARARRAAQRQQGENADTGMND